MHPAIQEKLEEYRAEHQNFINELLHFIGIPLIVSPFLILTIKYQQFFPGLIVIAALYTILGGWRGLALGALLILSFILLKETGYNDLRWSLGFFVIGWTLQIPGHYIFEKNEPALRKSWWHLLIAPLWWIEVICLYPLWKKIRA